MDWKCTQCGYAFEPKEARGDIQCPRCGALQDFVHATKAPNSMASLGDRTEWDNSKPAVDHEKTVVEPPAAKMEVPEVSTHERGKNSTPQVSSPDLISSPANGIRAPRPERILNLFGPTLLVCLIFIVWVIWDKKVRPSAPPPNPVQVEVQKALAHSIESLRVGDRSGALLYSDEALRLDPGSELANEVHLLLHSPASNPPKVPPK